MKLKNAFTILELSMSLIIVTLLITLVTTGLGVIRSAENRKIISEYNIYKTAINNFKLQYGQLPGDFNNAYNYWPSVCVNTNCNGNGNGIIEYSGSLNTDESLRAWQHLGLAGFISGSFTGIRASITLNTIGNNVPASQILGAGWEFYNTQVYSDNNLNTLILGATRANNINDAPAITAQTASEIDYKMDDGSARTGNILGLYSDDNPGNYGTGAASLGIAVCVQNAATNSNNIANNGYYYVNIDNGQAGCALQFMF